MSRGAEILTSDPIFIIAAARSGTKFLRDCLAADPRICVVPHDVNYIWRYGQEGSAHDVLDPSSLTEDQRLFIRRELLRLREPRSGCILLEKTVSNSLRVPYVDAVFPNARYVHLIRDGRDVARSALKEWRAPREYGRLFSKLRKMPVSSAPYLFWYVKTALQGLMSVGASTPPIWGPRYPGIYEDLSARSLAEVCGLQWQESVRFASQDLSMISKRRVFQIRYEDLVSSASAINELAEKLGLDTRTIEARWGNSVRPNRRSSPSNPQSKELAAMEKLIEPTLASLGYE